MLQYKSLGARLSWHFANGWIFEPAIVGPDIVDYTLKVRATRGTACHPVTSTISGSSGSRDHGRHEESGALVHITWYLETQTVHRFAALPCLAGRRYDRLSG